MTMETFITKQFNIPELVGISAKNIEEHLKLYQAYVKNANTVLEKIQNSQNDTYELAELQRRFSFEFNGARNHEYYFASFEGGAKEINKESKLHGLIVKDFGSFENFISKFKNIATTRGIGWAMLYYDKNTDTLLTAWVDEQHLGLLNGLSPILCLDMWEHAFITDYFPSGKKQYIEDFFKNLNWEVIKKNFNQI